MPPAGGEFKWARSSLEVAEGWIKDDKVTLQIADNLSSAISHAIWGWLEAHGIDPGSNNEDAAKRFGAAARKELRDLRSEYTRKWGLLVYRLIGDPDDIVKRSRRRTGWRSRARRRWMLGALSTKSKRTSCLADSAGGRLTHIKSIPVPPF